MSSPLQTRLFSGRAASLWCALLLVVVTMGTFGRVVNFDFLSWDDSTHIYQNRWLDPPSAQNVAQFWSVPFRARAPVQVGQAIPPYEQLYAPLTFSLYAALCDIARLETPRKTVSDTWTTLNPAVFHAANLLVHLANVLLVFLLLKQLTRSHLAALGGALLFAVHPVQVEAVAWVTQLNTLLSTFFSLWALILWVFWLENRAAGRTHWPLYLLASGCFLLALLAKPVAVVVPLMALILATTRYQLPWRAALSWTFSWFGAALLFVLLNKSLQPASDQSIFVPIWLRPFQIGDALAFYGAKLLLPLRQIVDYSRSSAFVLDQWWGYLTGLAPVVFGWFLWRQKQKLPTVWMGFWLFVVAVFPTLGAVSYYFHWYSTVSDRYVYLAMAGAAVGLAGFIEMLEQKNRRVRVAAAVFLVVAVVSWSFQAWRDTANWRDTQALWVHNASLNPRSWLAANNLANYYSVVGNLGESRRFYEKAVALKPNNADSNYNLGLLLGRTGERDAALRHLQIAARSEPRDPEIWNALAVIYARQGDIKRAIDFWKRAIEVAPNFVDARVNYGVALAMQGQDSRAITQWNRALEIQPQNAELRYNLGVALLRQGRRAEAARQWQLALQADPRAENARRELRKLGITPTN